MSKGKIVATILSVLVLIGGIIAGVVLVKQRQDLIKKAAVPGGQAKVSLFPTSGTFNVGDTLPVSVYFNTSTVSISGVIVRLRYPYSGASPEVTASNIVINSIIEGSGDWNCPTKSVSAEGGNVIIDIACANISAQGYSNNTDTLLATFDLTVGKVPASNPLEIQFDPSQSIITQKSNGQDILNIPDPETGKGVYSISGGTVPTAVPTTAASATSTPTPTVRLTTTPTITPTGSLTATPTLRATSTPTTGQTTKGGEELPSAGFGAPTIVGLGLGMLLIISSLLLAL
ncbi:hypothetical protein A3A76_01205 [Candidatus Woesebacteria bacterium RIFCSPLOWO2_01_FULL_39_23]|uniref:Cohesin domain-containing protein n=1 Tax=Candidatus Woesebacteria bacterium RIFCSPHIGHO2_01_FULL_40_22 TaxID=1802499 RepID=A0A1F7YG67_9BACT|nr:MAG: hypothetical protein A2141_04650 [Candidatus Woesebacteria bacterium RBG_16_40_11]OGM25879.1 MAG: hypothetical protein A2628_04880 [Candidatus Woesebacteria bacterium RIFCSPHIGHO2_01_FULL_40_22]OGM61633.1 MAG: hypothetical protein A3A76_01205 [Candidatus Woesebacteria bacterium RIFCSPLOWO2_01_FULL_39_23]